MLALRCDRLWSGAGSEVVSPAVVVMDRGTILSVEAGDVRPPDAAHVVDLEDATVVPGLVDAHVHLCFDASDDVLGPLLADDDGTLLDRMHANARRALAAGVTTVRDLGDRRFLGLELRKRYAATPEAGPEVIVSGPPITRTKGHCWFLGGESDGVDDVRAAAAERARRGCDVVKVMTTGGVLTPGFAPGESQYGIAELRALVDEARRHGLPVASHAHGIRGIADSVEAGVDSVEHCSFLADGRVEIDWAVVERMAARGTYVGLTLAVDPRVPVPAHVAPMVERLTAGVSRMHRSGARIVCGSDAGIAPSKPHDVLPHGAVDLVRAGLANADALASVTTIAAEACGVAPRKGRIVAGADADLLAVDDDPLEDITALLRVRAVFRAGVRVR